MACNLKLWPGITSTATKQLIIWNNLLAEVSFWNTSLIQRLSFFWTLIHSYKMKALLHRDTMKTVKSQSLYFLLYFSNIRWSHKVWKGLKSYRLSAIALFRCIINGKECYDVCCIVISMTVAVEVSTFSSTKIIYTLQLNLAKMMF